MFSRIASRINKQKPAQKVLSSESAIAVKTNLVVKCTLYLQAGRRCYLLMCARFLSYFLLFDKEAIEEIPPPTVGWGERRVPSPQMHFMYRNAVEFVH